jgi:hypothetical protein
MGLALIRLNSSRVENFPFFPTEKVAFQLASVCLFSLLDGSTATSLWASAKNYQ